MTELRQAVFEWTTTVKPSYVSTGYVPVYGQKLNGLSPHDKVMEDTRIAVENATREHFAVKMAELKVNDYSFVSIKTEAMEIVPRNGRGLPIYVDKDASHIEEINWAWWYGDAYCEIKGRTTIVFYDFLVAEVILGILIEIGIFLAAHPWLIAGLVFIAGIWSMSIGARIVFDGAGNLLDSAGGAVSKAGNSIGGIIVALALIAAFVVVIFAFIPSVPRRLKNLFSGHGRDAV